MVLTRRCSEACWPGWSPRTYSRAGPIQRTGSPRKTLTRTVRCQQSDICFQYDVGTKIPGDRGDSNRTSGIELACFYQYCPPHLDDYRRYDDLAGGDTWATIPFAGRAGEIGETAGAVEVFRREAL